MRSPYHTVITIISFGNNNNSMHMVGHNLVRIQFYVVKMIGNGQPTFVTDFPEFIQYHFIVSYLAEQTFAILQIDRYKIMPGIAVVPAL